MIERSVSIEDSHSASFIDVRTTTATAALLWFWLLRPSALLELSRLDRHICQCYRASTLSCFRRRIQLIPDARPAGGSKQQGETS